MLYQVVARPVVAQDGPITMDWDYYPYWAPGRDRGAAERLAQYAAKSGYEAAILQALTAAMLETIARRVVDLQDGKLVPALRYLPGTSLTRPGGRVEHEVEAVFCSSRALDPYDEGPDKSALDKRRLELELGAGGDVMSSAPGRGGRLALPHRMDVLSAWLRLRERFVLRQLGGVTDGAQGETTGQETVG